MRCCVIAIVSPFHCEAVMTSHRADLKAIARRAMVKRELSPDFSPGTIADLSRILIFDSLAMIRGQGPPGVMIAVT